MYSPIVMEFKKSIGSDKNISLDTFTSYSFERNIMVPASAFRFTAPGVSKEKRMSIRSADNVYLYARNKEKLIQIATGIVDDTDTHITPNSVEYVLTGRDLLGQLVDNACVDSNNLLIRLEQVNLGTILSKIIENTRIPQAYIDQQAPNANKILFQTNAGETKISSLQRYLDLTNCLVWCNPNGTLTLGKPNFTQPISGALINRFTDPSHNNLIECRVHRNVNTAIRQIAVQLQTLNQVNPGYLTKVNNDPDMIKFHGSKVGRSVYENFDYGSGTEVINTVKNVGNQGYSPRGAGDEFALRKIAQENIKILDVDAVVVGHINQSGQPYNIDQMYRVIIEDEDISEDLYVYSISYEMSLDQGEITRMKLCRKNTIVAYADALARAPMGAI